MLALTVEEIPTFEAANVPCDPHRLVGPATTSYVLAD